MPRIKMQRATPSTVLGTRVDDDASPGSAYRRVVHALGRAPNAAGMACCPAHTDSHPSLHVTQVDDRVLLYCHAGCRFDDVLLALGLDAAHTYDTPMRLTNPAATDVRYRYVDEHGGPLYEVVRMSGKRFKQVPADGRTGAGAMGGVRRVLFNLPEILATATAGMPVYIPEGEKDVLALRDAGVVATCNPGGAGKWLPEFNDFLVGRDVIIIADKDDVGRAHAAAVAVSLTSVARSVRVVEARSGKDPHDHLAAGLGVDDFVPSGQPVAEHVSLDVEPTASYGAALLDAVEAFLARFVAFPSEAARVATTLWVAHAHAVDYFESTPRLAMLSPEPGSGKTRVLEILELLTPRPMFTFNASSAALFRKAADASGKPTVLIDEADTIFGPRAAKDHEDLRGFINSGHRRGATAIRCVVRGKEILVEEYPCYAPVAIAGLDDLPETIMSRSVVVRMRRRAPHEKVEPFRRRLNGPDGEALRDRLAFWTVAVARKLDGALPEMPEGIEDRNADVWEALLAIADAAGGDWSERARVAAVAHVADARKGSETLGVRLLRDLREVFADSDKLATESILDRLLAIDDAPWADLRGKPLDARTLARRLAKFDVSPKSVRIGDKTPKGYERADFGDAWARYLPTQPGLPAVSATSATSATAGVRPAPTVDTVPTCGSCGDRLDGRLFELGHRSHVGCAAAGVGADAHDAPTRP